MAEKTVKEFYEHFDFERMVNDPPDLIKGFFSDELAFLKSDFFGKVVEPDSDMLEIGCGYGRLLKVLCEHTRRLVGIDFSRTMIDKARQNLVDKANVEIYLMDADKLQFPDEAFDNVVCLAQTFGNMPGIEINVLREMKRVTKKGGKVIINVFSEIMKEAQAENYKRLELANVRDDGTGYHTDDGFYSRRFTREQLTELFSVAGLVCGISEFSHTKSNYFAVAVK